VNRAKRTIIFLSCLTFLMTIASPAMSHDSGQNVQARAKAAFSQIRGTLKLAGLESAVNVIRDRWGAAHTYAENQHEARE
jgi:acyl-homoserine lactone acylase PvdQ